MSAKSAERLEVELMQAIRAARAKRPAGVDRTSARWLRLRAAIGATRDGLDPDVLADQVWMTVESFDPTPAEEAQHVVV